MDDLEENPEHKQKIELYSEAEKLQKTLQRIGLLNSSKNYEVSIFDGDSRVTLKITGKIVLPVQRQKRRTKFNPSIRMNNLFFLENNQTTPLPLNFQRVNETPPIYLIDNFLTTEELNYISEYFENNAEKFEKSFTLMEEFNCT